MLCKAKFLSFHVETSVQVVPCFPAIFDLLIPLGLWGLIILLLKSGLNLGPRKVIPYSPSNLLEFNFQPIRRRYSDSC